MFELDLDPETFFRKTLFTYGHRNVVRAVAAGLAQSGSVDGYVWEVLRETEPELVNKTRVLRKSELLGFPPIATSRTLARSPAIASLRAAFLAMRDSAQGRDVLHELRLTGFVDVDASVFDGIAAKVAELKGIL
jgi:phosphonate transport system substrate-binding protein